MRFSKKNLFLVLVLILNLALTWMFTNSKPINNILNNYEQSTHTTEDIQFLNWEKSENEGNVYYSQNDPILELTDLNCYVSDVELYGELQGDFEEITPQIFWKDADCSEYSEQHSQKTKVIYQDGRYRIPVNREVLCLRIDLTEASGVGLKINQIVLNNRTLDFHLTQFIPGLLIFVMLFYMLRFQSVFVDFFHSREIVKNLVKNDLKSRYSGSLLGTVWAFAQPVLTIVVLWFVFQKGVRQAPVDNIVFILWFVAGYIPWMYINDSLMASISCMNEYSYLVKKIQFRVDFIPLIKMVSNGLIHAVFILFMVIMYLIYGHIPTFYWLQVLYYIFCMVSIIMGFSFLFASMAVFLKDFGQIIAVSLQLLFWMTPVVWAPENMNPEFLDALKANPFYYVIQGYRESMIYGIGFWENEGMSIYFWSFATILLIVGTQLFQRVKPHFSDVL